MQGSVLRPRRSSSLMDLLGVRAPFSYLAKLWESPRNWPRSSTDRASHCIQWLRHVARCTSVVHIAVGRHVGLCAAVGSLVWGRSITASSRGRQISLPSFLLWDLWSSQWQLDRFFFFFFVSVSSRWSSIIIYLSPKLWTGIVQSV